jgi:hypothetical protein
MSDSGPTGESTTQQKWLEPAGGFMVRKDYPAGRRAGIRVSGGLVDKWPHVQLRFAEVPNSSRFTHVSSNLTLGQRKRNGGEGEIRTHVPELPDHPISSRRRYDRFGTSPRLDLETDTFKLGPSFAGRVF